MNNLLDKLLFHLIGGALALLVCITLLQIIARYLFGAAFSWAAELSITLMVWSTWIGACLALKQGLHLQLSLLEQRLGRRAGLIVRLLLRLLAMIFLAAVVLSWDAVFSAMQHMTMASMPGLPINLLYMAVPAGALLLLIYVIGAFLRDWRTLRRE
ncbi:MAG TPA: TRAP transporter small permease [Sedimenticola sp.]|nr:TRAP transporter small permease [Sedimenticola sp.]